MVFEMFAVRVKTRDNETAAVRQRRFVHVKTAFQICFAEKLLSFVFGSVCRRTREKKRKKNGVITSVAAHVIFPSR